MKARGLFCMGVMLLASTSFAADTVGLKSKKEKVSYAIGMDMGNGLKQSAIEVDPEILTKALKDVLTGQKTVLSDEEAKNTLMSLQKEMQEQQQAKIKEAAEKNAKEGEAFLAANKGKEGVKSTASGLQYQVLTEGKGKSPKETDRVTVHYKGTLLDGSEFDSSYSRQKPATFPVNGVIKGWSEALQLMKEGAKWKLFIPASLAYGENGTPGGPIGPNATLVFEVELISVDGQ